MNAITLFRARSGETLDRGQLNFMPAQVDQERDRYVTSTGVIDQLIGSDKQAMKGGMFTPTDRHFPPRDVFLVTRMKEDSLSIQMCDSWTLLSTRYPRYIYRIYGRIEHQNGLRTIVYDDYVSTFGSYWFTIKTLLPKLDAIFQIILIIAIIEDAGLVCTRINNATFMKTIYATIAHGDPTAVHTRTQRDPPNANLLLLKPYVTELLREVDTKKITNPALAVTVNELGRLASPNAPSSIETLLTAITFAVSAATVIEPQNKPSK